VVDPGAAAQPSGCFLDAVDRRLCVAAKHADEHARVEVMGERKDVVEQLADLLVVHLPAFARGTGDEPAAGMRRDMPQMGVDAFARRPASRLEMSQRRTPESRKA